ncbi:phosphate/phosphite/phosphonate ABC transporter substrate-binding protein [Thermomonas sp.]|uniref:phosphate/phosphite/phosphonate ABC transporter substrate-binding protein n=1 Tax=Thermomonas sp. TaxID=1971895 RepID=UPI001DB2B4BA|nr:phosphate/phosphite/phosphonate ABC transporter substrate-binding protein [Thermomonas sp.]MBZ0087831.1 phosphate/phosphite/phosphonate ABC transporter substrate-binding protein [Thermomonas sp.]MCO5054348.1 phosphate/phosphite/phosphonate ABC transporter substrate-binding protein [Thermomonas sp.]HRO63770.1 phosphate/phosphite/phosphonate ABC transporter substrate-binding protein [Thermomonas sp.]
MGRVLRTFVCLLCLLVAFVPVAAAQSVPEDPDAGVLVLGRISDNPKAHFEELKPLLDYLVPRLREVGIRSGRILMARDLQQMSSYLRRGRVDLINETAGNASVLEDRGVAHTFLISERDGVLRYHSLFFVRQDSPIESLSDLRGHSVAFQSPYSTSAYYLPASHLLAEGESLEPLLSPTDKPARDRVGYLYARTELNITTWVHKRLVDAGVLSNLDWIDPHRVPRAYLPDLRIIGRSEDVPRALMLARSGMDPRVEARLRELLLEAANDPAAAVALRKFMGTTRFVPIDETDRAALRRLARGVQRLRREVE